MIKDKLLADYFTAKMSEPFKWGVCDCFLFVCDWCEIATGANPAAGQHGKYSTEKQAYKYLQEEYANDSAGYFDKHFLRVEPNFEQAGDIVLCLLNGRETLGICGTRGMVAFKTKDALLLTKLAEKKVIWRVE